MKHCVKCGQENTDEANYCRRCGAVFDAALQATLTAVEGAKGTSLPARMWRAARLESRLYSEVAADTGANRQAVILVALLGLVGGLSSGLSAILRGTFLWWDTDPAWLWFTGFFLFSLLMAPVGWLLNSLLAWWLGTRVLWRDRTSVRYAAVLRAMGFADTPSLVCGLFYSIPYVGMLVSFPAAIWGVIAEVLALRQSLSLSTGRAVCLFLAVIAPYFVVALITVAVFFVVYVVRYAD